MLTLAFNIQPVKSEPRTWTVDDDGPADFHTIQEAINAASDGDTIFVYNGTYCENIVVNKTVSLVGEDKADTIINGSGELVTIIVTSTCLISDFMIRGAGYSQLDCTGIYINSTSGCIITNNNVFNNWKAIALHNSNVTSLSDNYIRNDWRSYQYGIYISESRDNIVTNNKMENAGNGVYLTSSCNNSIKNNLLHPNSAWYGIYMDGYCEDNSVVNNHIRESSDGILAGGDGNTIMNNSVSLISNWGITAGNLYTKIVGNTVEHSRVGLFLAYGHHNTVMSNLITNCWEKAIVFWSGFSTNLLVDNNITNSECGLWISGSFDNKVFHNNFSDNGQHVSPGGYQNIWDDGYPSGGNYWSDYARNDTYSGPYQNETGSDGIWDTPYVIDENNQDNYPLMEPWTPVINAAVDIIPNTLNLRSKAEYITAFIELPEGYNVSDIDVSSILLNNTIAADPDAPTPIGDYDDDGIPDLMVKFDRAEVASYLLANVNMTQLYEERFMTITLTITGKLNDGTVFQGSDTIRIMMLMPRGGGRRSFLK